MAMMAMAALGGAAFMMGDMFINSEKVIKRDTRIISYQLLVDTVRKNLYAGTNCTESLASVSGLNLTDAKDYLVEISSKIAPFDRGVELPQLSLKIDDVPTTLKEGWKSKSGTSIKSMRLVFERIVPLPENPAVPRLVRFPTGNPAAPLQLNAAEVYLVIEPDHKGINVWAPENEKYWIKLYTYYDRVANTVHSCYDPTSEAVFCTETMKGVYVNDSSLTADKRCQPDMGCFTYMNGVISSSVTCPADYVQNFLSAVGTLPERESQSAPLTLAAGAAQLKTCTWCPTVPYTAIEGDAIIGLDDALMDLTDIELDCSASNPYAGLSEQEAWENYLEYRHLLAELSPEQQAPYAGCLNYVPPCWNDPDTCQNECTGSTANCGRLADGRTCDMTCFIAGTQITMADGTNKTIEDVLLGEKVHDGSYQTQKVEKLWKLPYKGPIYGINGGKHFFTPNHPFMTVDGWKSLKPKVSMREIPGIHVGMLKVGDILVTKHGYEPVYALDSIEVDDFVYNLTISESHEYFADDYLVHNVAFKPDEPCIEP